MRTASVLLVLFAASAELWAQDKDTIKFKDPKSPDIQCVVGNLTFKTVEFEIEVGGTLAKQQADAKNIAEIIPGSEKQTFDFGTANTALQNGDFDAAIERFDRVRRDQRTPELQKQIAGISIVRAQFAKDNPAGVLAAVKSLRDQKPDTFFLRESYEIEMKVHLLKRDIGAARTAISAFEQRAQADGLIEWVKSAELMKAGLGELEGKHRESLGIYKKYSRDRDVGEDATLGELRCLTAIQDWGGASARAESVLTDLKGKRNANPRLLTAAFNARGEALLQANKPREAMFEFLQGAFALNKGGDTSREHETSLGRGAVAVARVAAAEKDGGKKATWKARATELLRDLEKLYPGSPLRGEAQKALGEVK